MQKKLPYTALAAALVLAVGCEKSSISVAASQAGATETSAQAPKEQSDVRDQVLVTVNGSPVTGEMFGMYFNERALKNPNAKNSPQFQSQALNELINIQVLAQAASTSGLDKRPDVMTALELQRDQLLSRLALQDHAASNMPDEAALKKAYEERYLKTEGEEYKARHILVETEEEANKLIGQIDEGSDFAELAKKHSTGPTGKNGGDLGWFDASQMVPPFAEALKTMQPGETSKAPVQTQFGWHVIWLEEKRAKEPPAFEAVEKALMAEAQRQSLADYVNKLRDTADIQINEAFTRKTESPVPDKEQNK